MKTRSGVVLLLALLAVVALELTAAALHFTALQQLRVARSGSRQLQLRLSAQGAAAAAVEGWPAAAALALPVGGRLPITAAAAVDGRYGIRSTAAAERLTDSLFLIRAAARSPLGEVTRIGLLVLAIDPLARMSIAALLAGRGVSLGAGGFVNARSATCDSAGGALELSDLSMLTAQSGATLAGAVSERPELGTSTLDALLSPALREALAHATPLSDPGITPGPRADGSKCTDSAADNWGEPLHEVRNPCSSWFPVLRREGDLVVNGGRGQGILYVTGNLVLTAGATFSGLILVGGRLSIAAGAVATGMVISLGEVEISDAGIAGNYCELRAVLAGVRGLGGPYAPGGRRWVPLF